MRNQLGFPNIHFNINKTLLIIARVNNFSSVDSKSTSHYLRGGGWGQQQFKQYPKFQTLNVLEAFPKRLIMCMHNITQHQLIVIYDV